MSRPRLLDAFCGAGGAARGYQMAGFHVTGVDIKPQPRYAGDVFHQGDALEFIREHGHEFDAIHASPPCQAYSSATPREHSHPDLYGPTRSLLAELGKPYVIENVIGAPYDHGIVLCGSMFGLTVDGEWIQRHRNFETSWFMFRLPCQHPTDRRALLVTGHAFIRETRDIKVHSRQGPFELAQRLMGIDWMTRKELVQAIPPAYTRFIGEQLLFALLYDGGRSFDSSPERTRDSAASLGRETDSPRNTGALAGSASSERSGLSAFAESAGCSPAMSRGRDVLA